jgi:hypothetical protein
MVLLLALAACGGGEEADSASTAAATDAPFPEVPPTTGAPATTDVAATEAPPITEAARTEGCADVVDVEIEATGDTFRVSTTVRSADTGWEKYADAWEVRDMSGAVLGERILAHPHVEEQPFTRSLSDVAIPRDVTEVEVAARDSVAGFCGATLRVPVPGH